MNERGIIVAGLGPAGAGAAWELARAGRPVVVLAGDEGSKPCGGCVSLRGRLALEALGAPEEFWAHPVTRLWLGQVRRPAREFPVQPPAAWLLDRDRLDAWLARAVAAAGARVVPARLTGFAPRGHGWRLTTSAGDMDCRWLIGADGAHSRVARELGLKPTGWRYAALVAELPMPAKLVPPLADGAFIELGGVPGGYAWAFGRGPVLNLGLAGRGRHLHLHRRLAAFTRRLGLEPPGGARGAAIPCPAGRLPRLGRDGVLLAGDAAGLADPFLGEGIAPALLSGRLAARAILADDPGRYRRDLAATLGRDHRHAAWLARLVYGASRPALGLLARHPGGIQLGWELLRGGIRPQGLWEQVARMAMGLRPRLDQHAASYYYN